MRFIAQLLLALSLLFFPALAFAEDDSSSSGKDLIRSRLEEKLNKLQTRAEEKKTRLETKMATKEARMEEKASAAAKVKEMRAENIKKYGGKMVERLEAMVERLEKLISRIESRLTKLEAAGKDISTTKTQVDSAKTKLAQAKTDLATLKSQIDTMTASETPKEEFARVRTSVKNVISGLKEVHRMLASVIGQIKGLRVGEDKMSPSPSHAP